MALEPAGRSARIPELDGLRGLAIALVMLWHSVAVVPHGTPGSAAEHAFGSLRLAWSGVDLFFVLSGFLIGGILLDHRSAPRYFQTFYARRALRILPLHAVWLGLFYVLPVVAPRLRADATIGSLFAEPMPAWSYVTFTQNVVMAARGTYGATWLGITWSLCIEEHFYLVLPWALRWTSSRLLPLYLIAVGLPAVAARLIAGPDRLFVVHVLSLTHTDALIAGVLCAYIVREEWGRRLLVRARPILQGFVALVVAALLGLSLFRHYGFEGSPFIYSVLAALYAALLLLVVTPGGGPVPWLARRQWLRNLGIVAYAVYLMHQVVSYLLHGLVLGAPPTLATAAGVAVTIGAAGATWALATLSWRFFEGPLVACGHRLDYGDSEYRTTEVATEAPDEMGRPVGHRGA